MFKYLESIIEILIGTVAIFFGTLLTIWGDSISYGLATAIIGLFIYLIAIKNSPKSTKSSKLKMKSSKRVSVILLCMITAFVFFAIGISNTSELDDEAIVNANTGEEIESTTIFEEAKIELQELDNYSIAIKECYKAEGFYDENLLVVVYSFTNNSNDTISFTDAIEDNLFQNGVELNLYIAANLPGQVDIRDSMKELKPGASFDVPRAYVLNFETPSDIEIELSAINGSGKIIKYTIDVK